MGACCYHLDIGLDYVCLVSLYHWDTICYLKNSLTHVSERNMAPTMCAPGVKYIAADLHITSTTVSTLTVTLYVLGIAIGPMFTSPLSEMYGRVPVYHGATTVFVAFIIGNALSKTTAQFMVFRFISGCAGGTPMALGGGTIADITSMQKRAVAMAFFSMGPLAGPVSVISSLSLGKAEYSFHLLRFSVLSLEASWQPARAGVGPSGFFPSWEGFSGPSPCFFCGKRTQRCCWSERPLTCGLLQGIHTGDRNWTAPCLPAKSSCRC